jgi:hypothetical protein
MPFKKSIARWRLERHLAHCDGEALAGYRCAVAGRGLAEGGAIPQLEFAVKG